jgi:nitrite reductase/ring-hydroxylating ferredoxin subunit
MKELKIGPKDEDKVLIAKYKGKLYSVGNFCTHFGAPLSTGVLFEDKVVCPWHGAGFNITTGAHNSAPAVDGLPTFEITEKGGKFYVRVPDPLPRAHTQKMAKRDPNNKTSFVIIGGGPSGLSAAETLR